MRKLVEQVKTYYKRGIYTIADIKALLRAEKITDEEYAYIVGDDADCVWKV